MEISDQINYTHFSHGADIGIRGTGRSEKEAFEMAGMALTAVVTDPKNVSPMTTLEIKLEGNDPDLLFYDWINALVYEMDTRKMLFSRFDISINDDGLTAYVSGEKVDKMKHDPAVEVKGATLTELKVENHNNQWIAQCVVDV